jgi:DNA-binding MarR family transcriptional regulator
VASNTGRRPVVDVEPLMAASRVINAIIVKSLAAVDADLTVRQLRVLVILTGNAGASLSEVAEDLGVNPSNASRACEQLVRRGLVTREQHRDDRRRVVLDLSAQGRRMVEQVMDRRRRQLDVVVASMPAGQQRALMAAMESFTTAAKETGVAHRRTDGTDQPAPWLG